MRCWSTGFIEMTPPTEVKAWTAGIKAVPAYLYCGGFFDTLREIIDKLKPATDQKVLVAVVCPVTFCIRGKMLEGVPSGQTDHGGSEYHVG